MPSRKTRSAVGEARTVGHPNLQLQSDRTALRPHKGKRQRPRPRLAHRANTPKRPPSMVAHLTLLLIKVEMHFEVNLVGIVEFVKAIAYYAYTTY